MSPADSDARTYPKEGKHVQSGYTWVTLPMLEALEKRLGREAGTELETIFKGDACVIRLGERWRTVKQLPRAPRWGDEPVIVLPAPPRLVTPDMPADTVLEPDPFPAMIVITPVKERDEGRPFSNARLAASAPHEELAIIVSSW